MRTNKMEFVLETLGSTRGGTMPISTMNSRYSQVGHRGLQDVIQSLVDTNKVVIVGGTHLRLTK